MNELLKNKRRVLTVALLLAATFHIVAALLTARVKLHSEKGAPTSFENSQKELFRNEEMNSIEKEVEMRNLLLAEAFQTLHKEQFSDKKRLSDDFLPAEGWDESLLENDIAKISPSLIEPPLSLDISPYESSTSPYKLVGEIESNMSEISLPEDLSQLILDGEINIAKDFIQAIEKKRGDVVDECIALYSEDPSLQAGVQDAVSDRGNSFCDRSGIVEMGRDDEDAEEESGIIRSFFGSDDSAELIALLSDEEKGSSLTALEGMAPRYGGGSNSTSEMRSFQRPDLEQHVAESDDFDIITTYSQRHLGKGYLFKIELKAKNSVDFGYIKQNLFFLIDRSYSIDATRFEITKAAVADVLDYLPENVYFNIVVFDQSVAKFANRPIPLTKKNVHIAKEFVASLEHGNLFTATDVTSPLTNIIPSFVPEKEVNTAILLSDGDTSLNPNSLWDIVREWTKKNSGKVALYSLSAGKRNNFQMLDMLSSMNKGTLFTANSYSDIPATLKKLVEEIKSPIGKNITVSAIPKNENSTIFLTPSNNRLSNLYSNNPLTIYGYSDTLDDFYLFFQGKYYDERINIKQIVSLKKATRAPSYFLEKMWALQNAYEYYQRYLYDNNENHLQEAKRLLAPFNISYTL